MESTTSTGFSKSTIIGIIIVLVAAVIFFATRGSSPLDTTPVDGTATTTPGETPASSTPPVVTPPTSGSPLSYTVATTKSTYTADEVIDITIVITNNSATEQTLKFNNGCQASYQIDDFDLSKNIICTTEMKALLIPAHDSAKLKVTHYPALYRLTPGVHTVIGKIPGFGQGTTKVTITGPAAVKPTVKVTAPAGGVVWTGGKQYPISWNTTGTVAAGSYYAITLEPGMGPLVVIPATTTSYMLTVPKTICWGGDACEGLTQGAYFVRVTLYDAKPCIGRCITSQVFGKVQAFDDSDAKITFTQ